MSNDTDDTYYTYQDIERGSYPELKPVDYNNINTVLTLEAFDRATKAMRKQAHTDPATE